jgi:hypothetical protein
VQKIYLAIQCRNDFLEEAMVLGISLALFLLPGGAAATATPPDGPPLAEHDIPISDDPGGGGGGKYAQCLGPYPKYPSLPNGKQNVLYYAGGVWHTAKFDNLEEANGWIGRSCATCSL